MEVFLINLARRPDRLLEMTQRLNAIGIHFTRVEAVDGRTIDPDAFTRRWIARWCIGEAPDPLLGAVACFLSHRKVWQKMIDEDKEGAFDDKKKGLNLFLYHGKQDDVIKYGHAAKTYEKLK